MLDLVPPMPTETREPSAPSTRSADDSVAVRTVRCDSDGLTLFIGRELLEAIARAGGASDDCTRLVMKHIAGAVPRDVISTPLHTCSAQQRVILEHLAAGRTDKQIAARVGCPKRTVEYNVRRLKVLTGTDTRTSLVAWFCKYSG